MPSLRGFYVPDWIFSHFSSTNPNTFPLYVHCMPRSPQSVLLWWYQRMYPGSKERWYTWPVKTELCIYRKYWTAEDLWVWPFAKCILNRPHFLKGANRKEQLVQAQSALKLISLVLLLPLMVNKFVIVCKHRGFTKSRCQRVWWYDLVLDTQTEPITQWSTALSQWCHWGL